MTRVLVLPTLESAKVMPAIARLVQTFGRDHDRGDVGRIRQPNPGRCMEDKHHALLIRQKPDGCQSSVDLAERAICISRHEAAGANTGQLAIDPALRRVNPGQNVLLVAAERLRTLLILGADLKEAPVDVRREARVFRFKPTLVVGAGALLP